MKNLLLLFIIAVTLTSCSESNPYVDKIKVKVKQDALGVEMNYKSISFKWVDTLTVGKQISKIESEFEDGLNSILYSKLNLRMV